MQPSRAAHADLNQPRAVQSECRFGRENVPSDDLLDTAVSLCAKGGSLAWRILLGREVWSLIVMRDWRSPLLYERYRTPGPMMSWMHVGARGPGGE